LRIFDKNKLLIRFAPLYIEAPSGFSTQWLYDHVAALWKANDSQTVKDGGYYTKLIRPGLRVIGLNNNLCFVYNFWVLYDVEPIREQFQWLHDTLLEAEEAGERVHILAHIPSGSDGYHEACSREFQRIVERFQRTIAAQFNGHTEHFDFHLAYEGTRPIAVAFNGGALASYSRQNRNYVVYSVDAANFVSATLATLSLSDFIYSSTMTINRKSRM
jgi:sphingomyelin phosphodiesterase